MTRVERRYGNGHAGRSADMEVMIVLGDRHPEPARPSRSIRDAPSSRFSMTAKLTSERVHGLTTRNSASSNASGHGSERNCS